VGDGDPKRDLPAVTPDLASPEQTLRAVRIMWFAFVVSIGLFYVLTEVLFTAEPQQNFHLVGPMLAIAVYEVFASVYYRTRFGRRGGKPRSVAVVKASHVFAFMMSESAALFGLVAYFVAGWPRYWIFFLIGVAGFLLNIPRREDFEQPRTL
jgi:hypothetical protein